MKYPFLYRALRKLEVEKGNKLIPKEISTDDFTSAPMFGVDTTFPFKFDDPENKVRQHQWKQNGFHTRGISFTPFLERAMFYAHEDGVIVKIDTSLLENLGIECFDVNKILDYKPKDIAAPEDNEIILTYKNAGEFPSEIIIDIINL